MSGGGIPEIGVAARQDEEILRTLKIDLKVL